MKGRLFIAGALCAFAAVIATGGVTKAPSPSEPEVEPAALVGGGACGEGLIEVAQIDGATLCTHGPDPAAMPAAPSESGAAPEATAGIQCYGDGVSGPRVQVVYVHPSSVNRFTTLKATMLQRIAQVDAMFDASAAQTGGDRHVRWVTDSSCNLDVDSVTVSAGAISPNNMSTLLNELVAKGYDSPDRKYLIWADTNNLQPNVCYGLATLWNDDRPGPENLNNTRAGYGRIDDTCLNTGFDGRVEAHELMHTLGAVQANAPHASNLGHCTDDADRMCYDDDGPGGVSVSTVCSSSNEWRFDCRNDDYFYANPPCGTSNYVTTHWNTADNRWLERHPAAVGNPPTNDNVSSATALKDYAGALNGTNASATAAVGEMSHAAKQGGASVWYRWVAPVSGPVAFDTCGSDIDTLLGVYVGSAASYTALQAVASNDDDPAMAPSSRAQFTATEGTTYYIAVDGKDGTRGDFTLRWGAPPSGFTDVPPGIWFEQGVNWAKLNELLSWVSGSSFNSKQAANRAQVAYMLWTMMDSPRGAPPHGFRDVSTTSYYDDAIDWAKANGLVTGFPDNTYRPADPVNRAQIVSMIWNLVGQPGGSPPHGFKDVAASAWFSSALSWAKAQGLVTGFPGNLYKSKDPVNRAQTSSMLFGLADNPDAWVAYSQPLPSTVVF